MLWLAQLLLLSAESRRICGAPRAFQAEGLCQDQERAFFATFCRFMRLRGERSTVERHFPKPRRLPRGAAEKLASSQLASKQGAQLRTRLALSCHGRGRSGASERCSGWHGPGHGAAPAAAPSASSPRPRAPTAARLRAPQSSATQVTGTSPGDGRTATRRLGPGLGPLQSSRGFLRPTAGCGAPGPPPALLPPPPGCSASCRAG